MSDEMISRTRARTVRLACQAAALVLVAGAVLLGFTGAPFLSPPRVEEVSTERIAQQAAEIASKLEASKPADPGDDALPPDWEAIDESLAMVKNAPQPKAKPEAGKDDAGPKDEVAKADSGGRTRFLGTISIGDRVLALLSAGGRQRIMGEGDKGVLALAPGDQGEAPKVEVKRVSSDTVVLTENGVERRVERAPRTGFAVSQGAMPVSPAPNASEASEAKNARFSGDNIDAAIESADKPLNPDDFRREDGTIDYESLRKAARARAKARQALRQRKNEQNGRN